MPYSAATRISTTFSNLFSELPPYGSSDKSPNFTIGIESPQGMNDTSCTGTGLPVDECRWRLVLGYPGAERQALRHARSMRRGRGVPGRRRLRRMDRFRNPRQQRGQERPIDALGVRQQIPQSELMEQHKSPGGVERVLEPGHPGIHTQDKRRLPDWPRDSQPGDKAKQRA